MKLWFTFPNRSAVLTCLLLIAAAMLAIVFLHQAPVAHAQSNSGQLDPVQGELQQLTAEVNAFLERSRVDHGKQNPLLLESVQRQQLLRRLSLLESQVRSSKSDQHQSQSSMNTIGELEAKVFNSLTPVAQPATESLASKIRNQIRKPGDSSQTDSTQIHPDATGTVTGKVIDTGAHPIANVSVVVTDGNGNGGGGLTDSTGNYSAPGISPGTYYVITLNQKGYFDQIYDGQPCLEFRCLNPVVASATPISVTSGSTTANIDFTLKKGGAISIKTTDAGTSAPLPNMPVSIYDGNGIQFDSTSTDATGNFMSAGLPPGTYYAVAFGRNGYIGQIYNNIMCVGHVCNAAAGTPIAVNTSTVNITLALTKGGTLSGVVTDASNSAPVASLDYNIVNSSGSVVDSGLTDASGAYQSQSGLPAGNYFAKVLTNDIYLGQIYNGIPCPDPFACQTNTGTPISVTTGNNTGGINFALQKGGEIGGKVTDASNSPLANVEVDMYDANGTLVDFGSTDASGNYVTLQALPAGTYYARTINSGFIDQLYNGITCTGDCDVTTGSPITVTLGATTGNINFSLQTGGSISGKILDAGNNFPISSMTIQAYDSSGNLAGSAKSNNPGLYTIFGLPAGSYYLRTTNTFSYIDQLYSGIQCAFQNCPPTSGTPVTVTNGTTTPNIDFTMQHGGRISGVVTNAANSLGIVGASVRFYDANGIFVSSADTFNGGIYFSGTGFPTGTYFARTSNDFGYLDQLYQNLSCALGCVTQSGTPISVTAGTTSNNVNFALQKGSTISGQVTDAVSHAALTNVFVDIYDSSGTFITNGVSDGAGNFVTFDGLPSGNYFASTSNSLNYLDGLYNGLPCPLSCDPTTGTPIIVTAGTNLANVNFALTKGGTITGKVTDMATSAGLGSVSVNIYDSGGNLVTGKITNGAGVFSTSIGLPAGTYFARTQNSIGYLNQLFDGVACPQVGCTPTDGTPINVTSGGIAANTDFALQKGGSVTGKVINSASNQPVSGVTVRVFASNGTFVTSGVTNGAGVYLSTAGLPTGVYFARTSNSLGYIEQLYQGTQCLGCSVTTGNSIPVVVGATTASIDFALTPGGTISGKVTDASNSAPLSGVLVTIIEATGHSVSSGMTDASGNYVTGAGLPSGSYFAVTSNESGYLDELYNAIPCPVGCSTSPGTPISVTAGANTSNVNFALPTAASSIQFSAASYSAAESSSSVAITVLRLGDLSGTATVDYAVSDGTASQKTDYTLTSGKVTFGVGQSLQTFNVLITKDAYQEPDETVNLSLSNPTGSAILGSPGTAVLTIINDPLTPATPNPNDDARTFVIQHYHDFLSREPDEPGLVFWTNGIINCGADPACTLTKRISTSAAFFLSIEFQETGGSVIRTQRVAFGKLSENPATRLTYQQFISDSGQVGRGVVVGQGTWDQTLEVNKQTYTQQVVGSPAFIVRFPISLSATDYVDALFASASVSPSTAERQAAIGAFGGGGTVGRTAALRSVGDSNSVRAAELNSAFVLMEYFGYLRRNPTDAPDNNDAGYQFWLTKLNSFNGDFNQSEMVKAFISSSEYRSRFGTP